MIENAVRIAIDPIYAPPVLSLINNKKYLLFDNSFDFNKFELIFDEITDGKNL